MSRREFFEESTVRKGFASIAVEDGGTEGQTLVLNADGEAEFGSGGLPSQWVADADGTVSIEPDDPTADGLFTIAAPNDFENQTGGNGDLLLLLAGDATKILEVDTYGGLTVKTLAGNSPTLTLDKAETQRKALLSESSLQFSDHAVPIAQITSAGAFSGSGLALTSGDVDISIVSIHASGAPTGLGTENLLEVLGGSGPLVTFPFNGGLFVWDGEGSGVENLSWWIYQGWEAMTHQVEPDDSQIAAGQVFSFYDATNGAAKFVRKGKTLDGTVVRAESAMAP